MGIRSHYKEFFNDYINIEADERETLFNKSKLLFQGDYFQDIFPRILTSKEYAEIKDGIEQRALAILAFLEDLLANGNKWSKVIPKNVLEGILNRYRTTLPSIQALPFSKIAFPYGPDIIRDSRGAWRVIEDSIGTLGGIGDIPQCRRVLYKLWPEWKKR